MQKLFRVMTVATLILMGLMATASAQVALSSRRVKIDFDFNVGDKQMPAGEYKFRILNNDGQSRKTILVEKMDGAQSAIILTVPATNKSKLEPGSIVFNRYDDQYFFASVQLGDEKYVQATLKSGAERDAASKTARNLAQTKTPKIISSSVQ